MDPLDVTPIPDKIVKFQLKIAKDNQDCDSIVSIFNCFDVIKQLIANYNLNKWNNEYQMYRSMCGFNLLAELFCRMNVC